MFADCTLPRRRNVESPGAKVLLVVLADGDVLAVLARAEAAFTAPKVQRLLERHSVPGVRRAR